MYNKQRRGFEKLHGVDHTSSDAVILTAKTVWKENNPKTGVLTKSNFIQFIQNLRVEDYDHTEALLVFLRAKKRMMNPFKPRMDKSKQLYYWAEFYQPNGNEGVKIIGDAELFELVKQYREGFIEIDFDIDDLIDEGLRND